MDIIEQMGYRHDAKTDKITPPTHPPFDITTILEREMETHADHRTDPAFSPSVRRRLSAGDSPAAEPRPANSATVDTQAADAGAEAAQPAAPDYVNHPPHYTSHPSGVECITITEWMNFNVGNAVKYLWRSDEKGFQIQDLKKARWYIDREIARLEKLRDGQA